MRNFKLSGIAFVAALAAVAIAGCSGGGSKSAIPGSPSGSSQAPVSGTSQLGNQSVGTTLSIKIQDPTSAQAASRHLQYLPTSAQSVIIYQVGDNPSATPAPGTSPPATAIKAGTVNLVTSGTGSNCTSSSGTLICTVTVSLLVGNSDLYFQAFSSTAGAGNLVAFSVSPAIYVNTNGTLTAGSPTGSAATLTALGANLAGAAASVAFSASSLAIVPGGIPNPTSTLPSTVTSTSTGTWGSVNTAAALSMTDASGNAITSNQGVSPVTISDPDTTGNTCLIYIAAGGTAGTTTYKPCSFAASGSTPAPISLVNSSDQFAVMYNNKEIALAGFKVTASIPGSTATATPGPLTVRVGPAAFPFSTTAVGTAGTGSVVYDPVGGKIYVSLGGGTSSTILAAATYTTAAGYGTPAAVSITSLYPSATVGVGTSGTSTAGISYQGGASTGGVNSLALGPDQNVWFVETSGNATGSGNCNATSSATSCIYVGVYAANNQAINSIGGTAAKGTAAEFSLQASNTGALGTGIASLGGYVWVTDSIGDIFRIQPSTGVVVSNLGGSSSASSGASAYATAAPSKSLGVASAPSTGGVFTTGGGNLLVLGTNLYENTAASGKGVLLITPNSGTPSTTVPLATATTAPVLFGTAAATSNLATDGTSVYQVNVAAAAMAQFSASNLTFTQSAGTFKAASKGGIGIGADASLWTLSATGVEDIVSITGTSPSPGNFADSGALCLSGAGPGSAAIVNGPDNTLLFAPVASSAQSVLCGLVY